MLSKSSKTCRKYRNYFYTKNKIFLNILYSIDKQMIKNLRNGIISRQSLPLSEIYNRNSVKI
jgi:hypothetical protein